MFTISIAKLRLFFYNSKSKTIQNLSETIQLLKIIRIFVPNMYTLREYLPIFVGDDLPEKGWDDGMYCLETDRAKILRSNLLRGFVSCFAFMLVDKDTNYF